MRTLLHLLLIGFLAVNAGLMLRERRLARTTSSQAGVPAPTLANPPTTSINLRAAIPPGMRAGHPFRWSQLESTNYFTFVANLRAIGCPEQTIRDIVTADLHALYATRYPVSTVSGGARGRSLADLAREQAQILAVLLGDAGDGRARPQTVVVAQIPSEVRLGGRAQPLPATSLSEASDESAESNSTPLGSVEDGPSVADFAGRSLSLVQTGPGASGSVSTAGAATPNPISTGTAGGEPAAALWRARSSRETSLRETITAFYGSSAMLALENQAALAGRSFDELAAPYLPGSASSQDGR